MSCRDCDVTLQCTNSDEEKRHLSDYKALRQSESRKQIIFKANFLLCVLVVLSADGLILVSFRVCCVLQQL